MSFHDRETPSNEPLGAMGPAIFFQNYGTLCNVPQEVGYLVMSPKLLGLKQLKDKAKAFSN